MRAATSSQRFETDQFTEPHATGYSKGATKGNWHDVWGSFDARRKAKGDVSGANDAADDGAGEPDMFAAGVNAAE